jgi:hypothetical protein
MPDTTPTHIQRWLDGALPVIQADDRFLGVAAGGSWLRGELDDWSDLDLILAVTDAAHAAVMEQRAAIAGGWGTLVAHFTGEHVGEPRLLICLYDDPLVHVDLKFVVTDELRDRVEDPEVLWERDGAFTRGMRESDAHWPVRDPQWIEDRFWTWLHYSAAKLGRGELFETVSALDFLRGQVLIPLAMQRAQHHPQGARRVEQRLPDAERAKLAATIAPLDAAACGAALQAAADCYRAWREAAAPNTRAEQVVMAYLDGVRDGL